MTRQIGVLLALLFVTMAAPTLRAQEAPEVLVAFIATMDADGNIDIQRVGPDELADHFARPHAMSPMTCSNQVSPAQTSCGPQVHGPPPNSFQGWGIGVTGVGMADVWVTYPDGGVRGLQCSNDGSAVTCFSYGVTQWGVTPTSRCQAGGFATWSCSYSHG